MGIRQKIETSLIKEERGKKNIEYADESWNPYTGCLNIKRGKCTMGTDCWAYIRAKMLAGRCGYDAEDPFRPTFHPDKLQVPLKRKKPTRYDCCFMGDIAYAKSSWICTIFSVIKKCSQHRFYFLTKCPELLGEYRFPPNAWLGVTVNTNNDLWRIYRLREIKANIRYVSFEPILGEITPSLNEMDWIILGAKTGRHPLQPKQEWVKTLVNTAYRENVPIFMKDNLEYPEKVYEFPKGS